MQFQTLDALFLMKSLIFTLSTSSSSPLSSSIGILPIRVGLFKGLACSCRKVGTWKPFDYYERSLLPTSNPDVAGLYYLGFSRFTGLNCFVSSF